MPILADMRAVDFARHTQTVKRALNTTATASSSSNSTSSLLSSQWTNPNDVLSVLLIIGGDIVQKALAQTSGGYFTPVCFSFGWVAYSFTALVGVIGDGRLLPGPDYPVRIFNLKNGYSRENRNWIIGRLLRDNEMRMSKTHPLHGAALRISIYEATQSIDSPAVAGSGNVRLFGVLVIILQLAIAAVPLILYGEWGMFLITAGGTLLAQTAGQLPQWRAEKLPCKRQSFKCFALTSGNGARDIMIVLGGGNSLDLEDLSAAETPRSTRLWDSFPLYSRPLLLDGKPQFHSNGTQARRALVFRGIPVGFWLTIVGCTLQSVLWLALLITVAGLKTHTWFLLLVGGIGMFQNAMVSSISRDPAKRNLPLLHLDTIISRTVMDGLMDLEVTHTNAGRWLREEFFRGKLRENEPEWWDGVWQEGIAEYDRERMSDSVRRGTPRSMQPKYHNTVKIEDDHKAKRPGTWDFAPQQDISQEETNTAIQRRETHSAGIESGPPARFRPLSQTSIDTEIMGPKRNALQLSSMIDSTVEPSQNRGASGKVNSQANTAQDTRDFQSPDRQDTGSSGSMSLDEMCKVYKLPDWAD